MKDITNMDKNDFFHKENNIFQTIMSNHSVPNFRIFKRFVQAYLCPTAAAAVCVVKRVESGQKRTMFRLWNDRLTELITESERVQRR